MRNGTKWRHRLEHCSKHGTKIRTFVSTAPAMRPVAVATFAGNIECRQLPVGGDRERLRIRYEQKLIVCALSFSGKVTTGRQGFSNGLAGIHLDDNGLVADVLLQENHDKVGHQAEMSDSIKLPTTGHRGSDGPVSPFSKWGTIQDLSSFGLRYGVDRILFAKSGQRGSTSAASALNLQAAPMLNLTANIIKGGEMVNRRSVLKIGAVRKLCSTWPF